MPSLWILFVLYPVRGWGLLDGAPLRSLEISAVFILAWLWWFHRHGIGSARVAAALLLAKIVAGYAIVPHGFSAKYYANAGFMAPHERSVEFPRSLVTRIDERLQFDAPAGPHLPLFFFNDNTRFNYYQSHEPGRGELPFSIEWNGYLWSPSAQTRTTAIRGRWLEVTVLVEGRPVLRKTFDVESATGPVELPAGWTHVTTLLSAPRGAARALEITTREDNGMPRPLGADVWTRPVGTAHMRLSIGLWLVSRAIDVVVLIALASAAIAGVFASVRAALRAVVERMRSSPAPAVLALACAVAFADSLAFARRVDGRLLLLSGGNDMLTYETFSRDIALNGPLMLGGASPGHATTFYFQPFYPYFLAAAHLLFGEDAFGIFLLQRCGLWVSLFVLTAIAHRLFGRRVAAATLATSAVFLYVKVLHWSSVLLSEVLFIPLVCVTAWALIAVALGGGKPQALAAGIVGGLATLTRSTLALGWLMVLPVVWLARRGHGQAPTTLIVMVLGLSATIGLATLRNWIAAGHFVPIASSGPVVLLLGNPPPPGTPQHDRHTHPLFRWVPLDDRTRMVLEGARHEPVAFSANLARKALYTLGFFGAYIPATGWSPFFVLTWSLALIGFTARKGAFNAEVESLTRWIPGVLAASHFLLVTLYVPHVYGDRQILPFYVLVLPYSGLAISRMAEWIAPLIRSYGTLPLRATERSP